VFGVATLGEVEPSGECRTSMPRKKLSAPMSFTANSACRASTICCSSSVLDAVSTMSST
jgi:hypothetical protein